MKCYLCNEDATLFLVKNGYTLYRCKFCGLIRTDLKQKYSEFVTQHYNKGYFTGDPTRSAYVDYKNDKPYITLNLRKYLKQIMKIKPSGKLLDVGCAMGFFVELALKKGFDAYGIDPSEYAVNEAQTLVGSERIKQGTLDIVKFSPKSFDVITLLDVFEHLADPAKDIHALVKLLKDDGILLIATGDTGSVAAKIFKRRWTFYIPPQHLFFFNKDNLSILLRTEHLVPVKWFRVGKWLSMRYVLHLARTSAESILGNISYNLLSRTFFGKIPLFLPMRDNIVVIVKKML